MLSSACAAGAYSATADEAISERFRLFGEKVGIAFQIKDDLFDYGQDNIGKPTGIDIKEKKMTLPLIYTLRHADAATKRKITYIVKNNSTDRKKVNEVIKLVQQSGGIGYAEEKMKQYRAEALQLLHSYPDTPERQAMEELVNFVIDRKY